MKWKGISPLEQHVDKAVLAVAVLFLLYVLYGFLITDRYTVEMNGEQVAAGQVDQRIFESAQRQLAGELDGSAFFEPDEVIDVADQFNTELLRPANTELASAQMPLGGPGGGIAVTPVDSTEDFFAPLYAVPEIPAPRGVASRRFFGTVDPAEPLSADLRELLPEQGPLDLQWVSTGGLLDTSALREAYLNPPENMRRIDPNWLQMFRIVDLRIQRRTRQPDGTWSQPELLPAMPGPAATFRELAASDPTPSELRDAAQELLETISPARSPFLPLIYGEFSPPVDEAALAELDPDTTESGASSDHRAPDPRMAPAPDSGRGGRDQADQDVPQVIDDVPLFAKTPTLIYGHDLAIEGEQEYQYRVSVAVLNPLFGRSGLNARQEARDQPLLLSPWSDWSSPVQTRRDQYVFVTSGSRGSQVAIIEVWRFYDGRWLKRDFRVRAGDPVGDMVERADRLGGGSADLGGDTVDLSTEFVVVDVTFEERPVGIGGRMDQTTRVMLMDDRGELIHHIELEDRPRRRAIEEDLLTAMPERDADESDDRDERPGTRGFNPEEFQPEERSRPGRYQGERE